MRCRRRHRGIAMNTGDVSGLRGDTWNSAILFTSHPNTEAEPYPHRDVHRRVTQQILRADQLGFDYAWIAEHHFSNEYGIMPDVFAGYLAALTKRIKIGTAVVTGCSPIRCGSSKTPPSSIFSATADSALGLGSGYRNMSSTASASISTAGVFRKRRCRWCWSFCSASASITMASISVSRLTAPTKYFHTRCKSRIRRSFWLARPSARSERRHAWGSAFFYRAGHRSTNSRGKARTTARRGDAAEPARQSGAGPCDVALGLCRRVDAKEKRQRGRHHAQSRPFRQWPCLRLSRHCRRDYSRLRHADPRHYSARIAGEIGKIEELRAKAHNASLMLHFPPWYGADKALASLEMFAAEVMPKFRQETRAQKSA